MDSDDSLNLPPESPGKWQVLYEFLKFNQKKTCFDVLTISDMKPFLHELRVYVTDLYNSRYG